MRVFVYEHLSSGALAGQPGAESLRREGWAMLSTVLADLARCPDVQPLTLVEASLVKLHAAVSCREMYAVQPDAAERQFRQLARTADFTLVIAPEFDDLLEKCCRWTLDEGSRLLGPSPDSVRLTGDKLALADHLRRQGVPTPPTAPCVGDDPPWPYPVVCKPRYGAGSQHTLRVNNRDEYAAFRNCLSGETGSLRECIVQPFVPGRSASVAFLAGPQQRIALPACEQCLSGDGYFRYLGGWVPLAPESRLQPAKARTSARAQSLAERAAQAVNGLTGYLGVDLVLGEADDGSGDAVIEINPRLTTSYVGLRRLVCGNLMRALLDLAHGRCLEPLEWNDGLVRFYPDGRIVRFYPDGRIDLVRFYSDGRIVRFYPDGRIE
jgi:predicted ATP-grasp superfamily ATP-dependent carboligase